MNMNEYKEKFFGYREYVVIHETSPYEWDVANIVRIYIKNDDYEQMREYARAQIETKNGLDLYIFYAAGKRPKIEETKEIVRICFPWITDEIMKSIKEYYKWRK